MQAHSSMLHSASSAAGMGVPRELPIFRMVVLTSTSFCGNDVVTHQCRAFQSSPVQSRGAWLVPRLDSRVRSPARCALHSFRNELGRRQDRRGIEPPPRRFDGGLPLAATALLTSQANRACPALNTLIVPTTSAFSSKPQSTHSKLACVLRLSADTWPQHGQVRLVLCGGTAMR